MLHIINSSHDFFHVQQTRDKPNEFSSIAHLGKISQFGNEPL